MSVPMPQGFTAPGFEGVTDAFNNAFSMDLDKGASVAVYHKGSLAVNLWGGLADEQVKRPWKEDTLGYFFSCGKFLSSLVVADLVKKGFLKYEESVSKYWPEFAQNGKEKITLNMLLSHTAGLPILDEDYKVAWVIDRPNYLGRLLQNQSPLWEPGKKIAYSNIAGGLYVNEIVKRVDPKQRCLSQYFNDEIAKPFELDIHIGLPKTLHYRTPRFAWRKYSKEDINQMMADFSGNVDLYMRSLRQPADWDTRWKLNDADFASLPIPSSHAIATAKAMAKLAGVASNGGQYEGKHLLTQRLIDGLQKPQSHGMDYIGGATWMYGPGTMLIPARQGNETWFLFGHTGLGGQVILVDTHHNFGFSYCTNYGNVFSNFNDNKWRKLLDAVFDCINRMEGVKEDVKLFGSYEEFLKDLKDHPVTSKL